MADLAGPAVDSRAETWAAAGIMATGVAWRYWMIDRLPNQTEADLGEAYNVARSVARQGTIADVFVVGQGPTAHLMPLTAWIAGPVYHWFGLATPASNLVLTTIALGFVFASFSWLFASFRDLGAPVSGRLLALMLLCWSPANVLIEVVWFRVWEGGMAVALASLLLYIVLRIDRASRIGTREVVGLSVLAAITLFVSPAVGVAAYLCALLLMIQRLPSQRWLPTIAIATAILVAILAPWTIRNAIVMGTPIVLRDDFGLALAISNHPSLVTSTDLDGGFNRMQVAIQPRHGPAGYAAMRAAGGEVAYSAKIGRETTAWIAGHPRDFLTLVARHLGQMLFPWPWMYPNLPHIGSMAARLMIHWLVSAGGLFGIGYALFRLDRRYRYAAIMTLAPILPYLVVQPILRYRYLIFGLLTFFAFDALARFARWLAVFFNAASAVPARIAPPAA